jgi:wyosine [tRNA(Phe)-imidazoG37] synthetase (radical SAM superfamily)
LAILTNASLLWYRDVRDSLSELDIVVAKLDAPNAQVFREVNRPHEAITFEKYLDGIRTFRKNYTGRFALQVMFTDANKSYAHEIAELAGELEPDEVQINTPLRPCAVKPINREEL